VSVSILTGDALTRLREMPDDIVDCCVTSPPYWGLRDYGVDGQIGLEASLAEHLAALVAVFEEVRRVLKPHGSLWLNYGDCYATAPNGRSAADTKAAGGDDRTFRDKPFSTIQGVLKPKDLCMLPNRLAIALQEEGWWVRSENIWGKPNPMPDSSGAYRPATAHEKIFLLTKSGDADIWRARDTGALSFAPDLSEQCPLITKPDQLAHRWVRLGSYFDAEAVRMPAAAASITRWNQDIEKQEGSGRANAGRKTNGAMKAVGGADKQRGHSRRHAGFNDRWDGMTKAEQGAGGRNLRNYETDVSALCPADLLVWDIAIAGYSGAHFATFPPALVVPCVLAGCPVGGVVLDPFGGAGTTGLVADKMGRDAILIKLNPDYAAMAADRLRAAQIEVSGQGTPHKLGPLFERVAA
jgi:DNA modification methylase